MKRDMELIRLLLLQVEGEEEVDLSTYPEQQQMYHGAMLIEAELCHGEVTEDGQGLPCAAQLTYLAWDGHEFLAASRDKTIWSRAMDATRKLGGSVTLPVLQALLTKMIKDSVGLECHGQTTC